MPVTWSNPVPGTVVTVGSLVTPGGMRGIQGTQGDQGQGYEIKGSVANQAALPDPGQPGDVYITQNDGQGYTWNPVTDQWDAVGQLRGLDGIPGLPGTPGTAGTDGINAFTNTDAAWTVPAVGATAQVTVDDAQWIAVGQFVWLEGAGPGGEAAAFKVTAVNVANQTVTLLNTGEAPLISTDTGNITVAGSDGGIYTSATSVGASTDPGNLLTTGSDGLIYLAPLDVASALISADEGNIAVVGSDGLVYVPGVKELEIDLDLYVPTTNPNAPSPNVAFPDIQTAWNHLKQYYIPLGRHATIHVAAGIFTLNAPLQLDHPNSDKISVIGEPPVAINITAGPTAWNIGSANDWRFNVSLANTSQISIGDIIALAPTGTVLYDGAHEVMNVTGTFVSLRMTSPRSGLTIVSAITGNVLWWPTRIKSMSRFPAHTISIGAPGLELFQNFAILDNTGTGNWGTIDISQTPSMVTLQNIAVRRADAMELRATGSGVSVTASGVFLGDSFGGPSVGAGIQVTFGAYLIGELSSLSPSNSIVAGSCQAGGITAFAATANLTGVRAASNTWGLASDNGSSMVITASSTVGQNLFGFNCSNGSFGRSTGGNQFSGNLTQNLQATNGSTIVLSDEFGPTTAPNPMSPAGNTVGNRNSIIAY